MSKHKSLAQDELENIIKDAFPSSITIQEYPLLDIIKNKGYSIKEIGSELGHKPHKMYVDIYCVGLDFDYAFEYQGEQHYHSIGNMNTKQNQLKWDQSLDEEKMWVLERLGVPIIQIPYDMHLDKGVIHHLVQEATNRANKIQNNLVECNYCGRLFPPNKLSYGDCVRCREEEKSSPYEEMVTGYYGETDAHQDSFYNQDTWEDDIKQKIIEEQKRQRKIEQKRQREKWKASPEYQMMKEEARKRRKEAYQRAKEERKKNKNKK